jgi:hypothetical protein
MRTGRVARQPARSPLGGPGGARQSDNGRRGRCAARRWAVGRTPGRRRPTRAPERAGGRPDYRRPPKRPLNFSDAGRRRAARPGAARISATARMRPRSRGRRASARGSAGPRAPMTSTAASCVSPGVPGDAGAALPRWQMRCRAGPRAATVHEASAGPVEGDRRPFLDRDGLVAPATEHPLIWVQAVEVALHVSGHVYLPSATVEPGKVGNSPRTVSGGSSSFFFLRACR